MVAFLSTVLSQTVHSLATVTRPGRSVKVWFSSHVEAVCMRLFYERYLAFDKFGRVFGLFKN